MTRDVAIDVAIERLNELAVYGVSYCKERDKQECTEAMVELSKIQGEAALALSEEDVSELRAMNADKAKTIEELSSTIFKRERTFTPAEREALEVAEHELHAASHCGTPFIVNQFMAAKADILRAMLAERSANE